MSVGKKNVILAIVLCISITVIGISFAYFTSGVSETGTGGKVDATTAELIDVSYDAGSSAINLQNVIPGATASKNFSVTITPTTSENKATYAIVLNIASNDFEKCDDDNYDAESNVCTRGANEITYQLTSSDGSVNETGDLTELNGKITLLKETKEVSAQTTYNYTLTLTYVNTGADQNHNANSTFTSNLNVEFATE